MDETPERSIKGLTLEAFSRGPLWMHLSRPTTLSAMSCLPPTPSSLKVALLL